jgi:hypothetical protein
MVVIEVDAHKRTHTLVAVDEAGRKLGERTLAATSEGHLQAARWGGQWSGARFEVQDCRHLTRRLEGDLLAAGFSLSLVQQPHRPWWLFKAQLCPPIPEPSVHGMQSVRAGKRRRAG